MLGRVRPLIAVVLLVLGSPFAAVANADGAPPVTVTDVKTTTNNVTGVLTFRTLAANDIDTASLKATIDGQPVPMSVEKATHVDRAAMLVIDTSGSMGASGMATVRSATAAYLKEVPSDVRVGVVTFADTAGVDLKPTLDRSAVQRVVNGLVARGDTSLYAAVQAAAAALGVQGDRSIVLLSDGADTMSNDPKDALAKLLGALDKGGFRLDVVRFRTNDPGASGALAQLAKAGRGAVVAADNAESVGQAFQSAARALKSQARFQIRLAVPLSNAAALDITGTLGGKPFSVAQSVQPGALSLAPTASQSQSPTPSPTAVPPQAGLVQRASQSSIVPWVAAGTIALAVVLLAIAFLWPDLRTSRERRLESLEDYVAPTRTSSRSEGKRTATPLSEQLVDFGEKAMKGRKSTVTTLALINRADLPLRAGEWFVLRIVAAVVGIAIGLVLASELKIVGFGLGLLAGFFLPQIALRILASRRAGAFERILPQSLLLVATSLRSGFGLPQALDSVARDSAEPVAKEFSRALAQTRIGTDISDSLEQLATRMGSRAMEMTVMAIRIQREVGGNLAETLETTGHTLREREAIHGQVRALSAEGRLSAYILIALPIGVFLYMMMVNYEYISLLWTRMLGIGMLIFGVVMLFLGILWMRKVVRIEV